MGATKLWLRQKLVVGQSCNYLTKSFLWAYTELLAKMDNSAPKEQNNNLGEIKRPEFTPDRSPKPLARNLDSRVGQLAAIVAKPTEKQIKQVEERLKLDDPGLTDTSTVAENVFVNFSTALQ